MADVRLSDEGLQMAAQLMLGAATTLRENRTLPMLHPETYTGAGAEMGAFMSVASIGMEAVSDAAGAAAVAVTAIMTDSAAIEAEISRALGAGFAS